MMIRRICWTIATGLAALACPVALAPAETAVATGVTPAQAARNEALEKRFVTQVQPLFNQYCYSCHGNGKKKGDLSLERFTSLKPILAEKKLWRNIAEMLEQQSMPPEGKDAPSSAELKTMLSWIQESLNYVDCSGPRDPGYVAIHRLNRNEYNNTIRDLVGVDFKPASDFPADDSGYGFDNIADVLTMSPLLAEKYLQAADEIFDRAIVDPRAPKPVLVKVPGAQLKGEVGEPTANAWNLSTNGQATKRHDFEASAEYEIRVRAWQEAFGDEPAKMAIRIDGKDVKTLDVTALEGKPGVYSIRQKFTAGQHKIALAYLNNAVDLKNPDPKKRGDRNLLIGRLEIEGPFNAPVPALSAAHKALFFVTPGKDLTEAAAARQIITRFATRAFRRPVRTEEVDRLMKLYTAARPDAEKFEAAVRVALSAVLVSPNFLYRVEEDPKDNPGFVHAINDFELASRLSYFLWSSMPDDELFALAEKGKLHEPATLDAQVKRMLADPKVEALVSNFTGQWLELRNLDSHSVDTQRFPNFNDRLRDDMKRETELFVENIIKQDRSVVELLNGDYTFVNARLAKHYGLSGVTGEEFQRVSLAGTRRGGVLTQASVLTVTAMATRTSPVKRGVFVLNNMFGTPPPPPPPDVPTLKDKPRDEASAPLKARLSNHRADPNCAVCHMRMDGIGFSLENFDATGRWRDKDGNFPVDSEGELVGGRKINGPDGLSQFLASRKSDFVRCLTQKMLTYALGRGTQEYDQCTIRDIMQSVESSQFRFSSLMTSIVRSDAFTKRRSKRGDE